MDVDVNEETRLDGYLKQLCWRLPIFLVIFGFCLLALVLSLVSLFFVDLDQATTTIVYVNIAGISVFTVGVGLLIRRCFQIDP